MLDLKYLPLIDKVFLFARKKIAPFDEVMKLLPKKGTVIDVGCGHGQLIMMASQNYPDVKFIGMDIDKKRLAIARKIIQKANVVFTYQDFTKPFNIKDNVETVVCFDILHHLPKELHAKLLKNFYSAIKPHGQLILKEIDTTPKWKSLWNTFHDLVTTGGQIVEVRSHQAWREMLTHTGFIIKKQSRPKKGYFYPHILIQAVKP